MRPQHGKLGQWWSASYLRPASISYINQPNPKPTGHIARTTNRQQSITGHSACRMSQNHSERVCLVHMTLANLPTADQMSQEGISLRLDCTNSRALHMSQWRPLLATKIPHALFSCNMPQLLRPSSAAVSDPTLVQANRRPPTARQLCAAEKHHTLHQTTT